jgi:hypothetical protein
MMLDSSLLLGTKEVNRGFAQKLVIELGTGFDGTHICEYGNRRRSLGKPSRLPTVLDVRDWQEVFKDNACSRPSSKPDSYNKKVEKNQKKGEICGKITLSP